MITTYKMLPKDIQLANAQLQDLNGDATVWDIFTEFDETCYRVMSLRYLKGRRKVKLSLVRGNFDFGDGYYTMHTPQAKHKRYEELKILDPKVQEIVNDINAQWENEHLEGLRNPEYAHLYLEAIKRRNHVEEAVKVLQSGIEHYHEFIASSTDKYDQSAWASEAEYLNQLIAVLHGTKSIETLRRKDSLRDIERRERNATESRIRKEVIEFYQQHPLSDEELQAVDILSENDTFLGRTFKYTRFEWKHGKQDWSYNDRGWINTNLIYEQWLVQPDGSKSIIRRDPREKVIKKETHRRMRLEGVEPLV